MEEYFELLGIKYLINKLLKNKNDIVIAIDGKAGSGKTTLANQIASMYDCNIIHCDDFYLPLDLRSKERYGEPGGNIHYERLKSEVIDHLNGMITFTPFLCKTMDLGTPITLSHKSITIIEGSYSLHPYFGQYYDLSICLTITDEEQISRIKKRNPDKIDDFKNKWIPYENHYLKAFDIENKADILLTNQ